MRNSVLSDRYAKAIFDIAKQENLVDELNKDLEMISETFVENQKLISIFSHPRLSKQEKYQIIDDFHGIIFRNEYIKNFLSLLVKKKREKELLGIITAWRYLYDAYEKQIPVEVISASVLSDDQIERLKAKLSYKTKKDPMINITIKPQILGGMIIEYEDKIIDGSVLKQVQQLTASIKEIPVAKLRGEVV